MERERERLLAEREDAHLLALRELKKKSEDALSEKEEGWMKQVRGALLLWIGGRCAATF